MKFSDIKMDEMNTRKISEWSIRRLLEIKKLIKIKSINFEEFNVVVNKYLFIKNSDFYSDISMDELLGEKIDHIKDLKKEYKKLKKSV